MSVSDVLVSCGNFTAFQPGTSNDDDIYASGMCVDNMLRSITYVAVGSMFLACTVMSAFHVNRILRMESTKRLNVVASAGVFCASLVGTFFYLCCILHAVPPLRQLTFTVASFFSMLSLVTTLVIWNTAQMRSQLVNFKDDAHIERHRDQAYTAFWITMGCYIIGLTVAGGIQSLYAGIANILISVCQLIGSLGVMGFGATVLWAQHHLSKHIDSLKFESHMSPREQKRLRKLKRRLPLYSRIVALLLGSMGLLSIGLAIAAFTHFPFYYPNGYFYLHHFAYMPSGCIINAAHIFTSWSSPTGHISSDTNSNSDPSTTPELRNEPSPYASPLQERKHASAPSPKSLKAVANAKRASIQVDSLEAPLSKPSVLLSTIALEELTHIDTAAAKWASSSSSGEFDHKP